MKLPLAIVFLLLSPPTAANSSRRYRRTLSATAKKPASVAAFLSLRLDFAHLLTHSLPDRLVSPTSPLLKLITQTPSSL
jgi:hypothetical protein